MTDLVSEAELLCTKCSRFPCTCVPDLSKALMGGEVCAVCRRNRQGCLCKSHQAVRPIADETAGHVPVKRHNDKTRETAVNEVMHHYYNRDPAAIARYIRLLLK